MSMWLRLIRVLRKKKYHNRQDLLLIIEGNEKSSTLDKYRAWLTRAGFLEIVSRGKYEVVKQIPFDLKQIEVYDMAGYKK